MTSEAQRIAIAEACGWTVRPADPSRYFGREVTELLDPVGTVWSFNYGKATLANWLDVDYTDGQHIPDYLNDLDAMHEAEKALTENQYDDFVCFLCPEEERKHYKSWGLEGIAGIAPRFLVSPTAAQRAEAFLRTLNLWTES